MKQRKKIEIIYATEASRERNIETSRENEVNRAVINSSHSVHSNS
jgi:hypothetical protein